MMKQVLLALAATVSLGACAQIDDNEIGLRKVYGEIQNEPVKGLQYYNFWTTDIIKFDNKQTPVDIELTTPTFDQQRATIASKTTVQLNRLGAANIYRNVGSDWSAAIIPQLVKSMEISVLGKQTAVNVIQRQSEIEQSVRQQLTDRLRKRGINLVDYQITSIQFSNEYMKAVEQKATAVQLAEGEKNKTAAVRERGEQTKIQAAAEAEAMSVRAAALEANPKLVQYEAVKAWQATGGKMPNTLIIGNGSNATPPFILGH